jgi:hypothetical protein
MESPLTFIPAKRKRWTSDPRWELIVAGHYTHTVRIEIPSEAGEAYAYIVGANIRRRHLTAKQKRNLIIELLKARPEKSDRQIAKTVKVSPTTVGTVRAKMEATGDVSKLDTRTDSVGREQPATKKIRSKPAASRPAAAKAEAQALERREEQARAAQDVGENSRGEAERLRVRVDEQANEIQRLRKENIGLQSEIEDLRRTYHQALLKLPKPERVVSVKQLLRDVDVVVADLAADPLPHPLDIPPSLRRVSQTTNELSATQFLDGR